MEDSKNDVKFLIENQLYKYIRAIKEIHKGKEAEELIKDFTQEFKKTVLKKYNIDNIDELITTTLKKIEDNKEKEIAD